MPEQHQGWRALLQQAMRDRDHGALAIAALAAEAFAQTGHEKEADLHRAVVDLARAQRAMAPVLNLAMRLDSALEKGGAVMLGEEAARYAREVETSLQQFASHLLANPPAPRNHWGFYSSSSTVLHGMTALQEAGLACTNATVGYSEPGGEGQATFDKLHMMKEMLHDTVLFEIVSKGWLDLLILGCDALDGKSFVNKIGSGPLARLASLAGSRVEVWTTTHKMVAPEAMPLFHVYEDDYDDVFAYTGWLTFGTGLMRDVSIVRCEHGVWNSSQAADFCANLPVPSNALKAAVLEMDPPSGPTQ